jgi:serine O-acetyltransferase
MVLASMIRSRADFLAYLEADRLALGRESVPPLFLIQDPIWFFQRLLRRLEYYTNCRSGALWWLMRMWLKFQMKRSRLLLGFNIPLNTIGPGLALMHEGDILIHQNARIGSNARMNIGVVIGIGLTEEAVPVIGDHVVIEPGAKIFGGVTLADWTHVGANAVVNRSVTEPGLIIAGVPAKVVKANPFYPGTAQSHASTG